VTSSRRRDVVLAGHQGDAATARAALADPDPAVRASAVGALRRLGLLSPSDLATALTDGDPVVRRRAAEEAAGLDGHDAVRLVPLLADVDIRVAEAAAVAIGERQPVEPGAVAALAAAAAGHDDVLVREAAVAALGSIGDPTGLPAVLAACTDVATVRRRSVLALSAFEGDDVEAALRVLATDRDRQVRQAAEDLIEGWGTAAE
jgi:HEAT repeat protein